MINDLIKKGEERILVVGDLHGDWGSLNKLLNKHGPDKVMQAGDFGWWPRMEAAGRVLYKEPEWKLRGIKPQGSMVYWIDGNHEDHDDLDSMGRGQKDMIQCYEGVMYKPRGSTMKLSDGRVILFIGGADSIDKRMRTRGVDWFPHELLSKAEEDRCLSHERVDIVISHTAPLEWIPDLMRGDKFHDPTRKLLSEVLEKYKPSLWYHGHWHKEAKGLYGRTRWFSLDYPNHGGRWWRWLDAV